MLLILDGRDVVERSQQGTAALEFPEKASVIDVEAQRPRGRLEIGAVDEERDPANSDRGI